MIEDTDSLLDYLNYLQKLELLEIFVVMTVATVLLIICNFGFSVYHVVMIRDENSSYFLLNVIYQQMAVNFHLSSLIMFLRVPSLNQNLNQNCIFLPDCSSSLWCWPDLRMCPLQALADGRISTLHYIWSRNLRLLLEELWFRILFRCFSCLAQKSVSVPSNYLLRWILLSDWIPL